MANNFNPQISGESNTSNSFTRVSSVPYKQGQIFRGQAPAQNRFQPPNAGVQQNFGGRPPVLQRNTQGSIINPINQVLSAFAPEKIQKVQLIDSNAKLSQASKLLPKGNFNADDPQGTNGSSTSEPTTAEGKGWFENMYEDNEGDNNTGKPSIVGRVARRAGEAVANRQGRRRGSSRDSSNSPQPPAPGLLDDTFT
jgi:hypothetical protein